MRVLTNEHKTTFGKADLVHFLVCGFLVALGYFLHDQLEFALPASISNIITLGVAALYCYSVVQIPLRFNLGLISIFLVGMLFYLKDEKILLNKRNFFGTVKIFKNRNDECNNMVHG